MTTTATKLTHDQMIRQAESDLLNLDRQEAEAVAKIKAAEAELATLQSRKESRAARMQTLDETVKHLQGQHATLLESARLAEGGLQQGHFVNKVRAAEKEKTKAEIALVRAEEIARREDEQDYNRLLTCSSEKAAATRSIHDIRERRTALTAAVVHIRAEQGLEEYRDTALMVELAKASVDAKREALAEDEAALATVLHEGVERLKDWPELAEKVRRLVPFEDDVTVLMEEAIIYVDALAERVELVPQEISGAHLGDRDPAVIYSRLKLLLSINHDDLYRGYGPGSLREQSRKLRLFLAAYRRSKREG